MDAGAGLVWNRNCSTKVSVGLIITPGAPSKVMSFVTDTAKKIAFWTYPRTSWQWDVLCVLILVFIFLTPKGWFENSAYQRTHAGQTTIVLSTDVVGSQADSSEIERRVRLLPGRAGAKVIAVRDVRDESKKLIAYEIDIR